MLANASLASALGRPDLFGMVATANTAAPTPTAPVYAGGRMADIAATSGDASAGDDVFDGRISLGILAAFVTGIVAFSVWTRGVRV